MFQNYVISALHSLGRIKLFAAINDIGIGVGLASCTVIVLFVKHEFSYDDQDTDVGRLYRIGGTVAAHAVKVARTSPIFVVRYE